MTNAEAGRKAIDLMREHGLYDKGWRFEFDNARKRAGSCRYSKKKITLSRHLTPHFKDEKVIDTILHEITHALVGSGHGHDKVWRRKAAEIGADPTRCYSYSDFKGGAMERLMKESKYTLSCNSCGHKEPRHRKPRNILSCGICYPRWNPKYKLELKQNH